jgi:hypothetical protein
MIIDTYYLQCPNDHYILDVRTSNAIKDKKLWFPYMIELTENFDLTHCHWKDCTIKSAHAPLKMIVYKGKVHSICEYHLNHIDRITDNVQQRFHV